MANLAEAIDPRRALIRRQLEAGAQSAARTPPQQAQAAPAAVRFERQFTPAERAEQARKLAEILRTRQ